MAPGDTVRPATVDVQASRPGRPLDEGLVGFDGPGPRIAIRRIGALRPAFIRTDVSFQATVGRTPVYNCATGKWNPGPLDRRVAAIRREHARALLIVDYMPPCLARDAPHGQATEWAPDPGLHTARWSALVEKMAEHEITAEGVRAFEIWNEPDWTFFEGLSSPSKMSDYLRLYRVTARALEAGAAHVHARIEVGGPAAANVLGSVDVKWFTSLFAEVVRYHLPLNFVSWHVYANDPCAGPQPNAPAIDFSCFGKQRPPGTNEAWYSTNVSAGLYASEVEDVRRLLSSYPSLHPKLWIDEWNLDAEYDPRQSGPYGAAFVAAVLDAVQGAGLNRMCYYNVADGSPHSLYNFGVLNSSGDPRPAYTTFMDWERLAGSVLPSKVTGPGAGDPFGTSGGVGAIASRSSTGAIHVLVYDFVPFVQSGDYGTALPTPTAASVSLVVHGIEASRYRSSTTFFGAATATTAAARSHTSGATARLAMVLPEEGLAFVSLVPTGST